METADPASTGDDVHHVLSERVRKSIADLIRNRRLVGGQVITEQRLADELGVSRTPLREALQRLEGEGMVEKNSGRSYMVRRVDMQEYMQSLKMRLLVEPEAAALSIGRLPKTVIAAARAELIELRDQSGEHTEAHWDSDDRVHRLCCAHCGNDVMFRMIEQLRVTTRLFEITDIRQRVDTDFRQHSDILDALESDSAPAARKAVATHIRSLITYSVAQIR